MRRKSATAAARLRRARALLGRRGGWIKGSTFALTPSDRFAYCLSGALLHVESPPSDFDRVRAAIVTADPSTIGSLISFNDRPSTRKKDVLAALDRAIEAAETGA